MHSAAPTKEGKSLIYRPEWFLRLKASKQVGRERNSGVARAPSQGVFVRSRYRKAPPRQLVRGPLSLLSRPPKADNRSKLLLPEGNLTRSFIDSLLTERKSINWRASLVPAAAVIPAPIAYIKVVAVKKLVVGSVSRTVGSPPDGVKLTRCGTSCRRRRQIFLEGQAASSRTRLSNNRSVMPLDVLGRTRATMKVSACPPWPKGPGNPLKHLRAWDWGLKLFPMNEEFPVKACH
ncbi:hypothetical protein L1887_47973 [Cichorium endivia]|nr:hypothetical protein L1887_47961 [Cichorium endivia]KAI3488039.1 hypothetical protein L1887_47967 [Cichorium endivia]KAI3488045.1 hypothetical protein L1887_47973 [Cichorium endivia]